MGGERDPMGNGNQLLCGSAWSSSDDWEVKLRRARQEALSSQEALGSTENQFCLWICHGQRCATQIPSCEERGQQTASSCQRLLGVPWLLRAAWPEGMPFLGVNHLRREQRESVKGQPFLPNMRLSVGRPCSEHPTGLAESWTSTHCSLTLSPPPPTPASCPSLPQVLISNKHLVPQTPPLLPESTTCDRNKVSTSFQGQIHAWGFLWEFRDPEPPSCFPVWQLNSSGMLNVLP